MIKEHPKFILFSTLSRAKNYCNRMNKGWYDGDYYYVSGDRVIRVRESATLLGFTTDCVIGLIRGRSSRKR